MIQLPVHLPFGLMGAEKTTDSAPTPSPFLSPLQKSPFTAINRQDVRMSYTPTVSSISDPADNTRDDDREDGDGGNRRHGTDATAAIGNARPMTTKRNIRGHTRIRMRPQPKRRPHIGPPPRVPRYLRRYPNSDTEE